MDAAQKADAFVGKYNGVYIDEDKWYGSQCWDLVARYAREMYGCPSLPTGSGGAEGLFRLFLNPIPQFFDKVPANDLQKGDIAVTTADFYPPFGHTFLVWAREGNTVWAFEQDGSKDNNGDGNADGVAYLVQRTITSKIAGGLRPKGANMNDKADNYFVQALAEALLGRTAAGDKNLLNNLGRPKTDVVDTIRFYPEAVTRLKKANDYDRLAQEFADYKKAHPADGGTSAEVNLNKIKEGLGLK